MENRALVVAVTGLIFTLSAPALGQTAPGPARFVSGTLEVTLTNENDEALAINKFRRGDSPFSNLRLGLFGDVVLDERLALFNQILIDPSNFTSLTTTIPINRTGRTNTF